MLYTKKLFVIIFTSRKSWFFSNNFRSSCSKGQRRGKFVRNRCIYNIKSTWYNLSFDVHVLKSVALDISDRSDIKGNIEGTMDNWGHQKWVISGFGIEPTFNYYIFESRRRRACGRFFFQVSVIIPWKKVGSLFNKKLYRDSSVNCYFYVIVLSNRI